jgi:hypothetical protein
VAAEYFVVIKNSLLTARFVRAVAFGADLAGLGMPDVLEDGQRLLPGLTGLGQVAGGVADIAEIGEDTCFKGAVADFPGDAECPLVAVGGFAEAAEMALCVAKAVPGNPRSPASTLTVTACRQNVRAWW